MDDREQLHYFLWMDDADLIKLHAMLSSDQLIVTYLEESLASEDPLHFVQALTHVALVKGIKLPPLKALSNWSAVHALLHELDCDGLFVRFVADESRVDSEERPRLAVSR